MSNVLSGIKLNKNLFEIVENKKVAIVGPASYLQGAGCSKYFDDYDVVIRPNEIIPQKNMRSDYGHKTDIMFCNFGTPWMPGIERKIKSEDREQYFKKLKLVVCAAIKASHKDTDYLNWENTYVSDVVSNFNKINKYNLPFYWIGIEDYKKRHSFINAEPNTGFSAIIMLLHYPIKEMLISGFTFYQNGDKYEDIYCPGHMDEIDTKGRRFGHGGNANKNQIKCFKKIIKNHSHKIKIDSRMNHILGFNHNNILDIT